MGKALANREKLGLFTLKNGLLLNGENFGTLRISEVGNDLEGAQSAA